MLKISLAVIALLVGALLVYAAIKPDTFRLERSATIAAPPDKVFALINDLRQFNTWNPYANPKRDPQAVITYDAVTVGVGGAYSWQGDKLGAGQMQIVESVAPQHVSAKLDFTKPFVAHNIADFTVQPAGTGSIVKWAMHGPMPYLNRLMTIFFDMDKMVGKDFEEGLGNLKALAEKVG
jgi:uncharacterized protein YndB with AHSA1/START domain